MKVPVKSGRGQREKDQSNAMITNTLKSYTQLALKLSKKSQLNDTQKEQVMKQWVNLNKIHLDEKGNSIRPQEWAEKQVEEVLNTATEVSEMLTHVRECNVQNVIHAAKLIRIGEAHKTKAKVFATRQKEKAKKAKRHKHDAKDKGFKHMSEAIGEMQRFENPYAERVESARQNLTKLVPGIGPPISNCILKLFTFS